MGIVQTGTTVNPQRLDRSRLLLLHRYLFTCANFAHHLRSAAIEFQLPSFLNLSLKCRLNFNDSRWINSCFAFLHWLILLSAGLKILLENGTGLHMDCRIEHPSSSKWKLHIYRHCFGKVEEVTVALNFLSDVTRADLLAFARRLRFSCFNWCARFLTNSIMLVANCVEEVHKVICMPHLCLSIFVCGEAFQHFRFFCAQIQKFPKSVATGLWLAWSWTFVE